MREKSSKRFPKIKIWKLLCFLLIVVILSLRFYFRANDSDAEYYVRYFYPAITTIWRSSNNFFPFSLSEIFIVLFPLLLLAAIIITIIKIVSSDNRKAVLKKITSRFISVCLVIISFFLSTFFLNFGFAYHRNSLASNLGYELKEISVEHLAETSQILVGELNQIVDKVKRNENGQFIPSLDRDDLLRNIHLEYKYLAEFTDNDFLKKHLYYGPVRLKPVQLSHYWSYTGTTGMFMPFWMESNINIDVAPDEMIYTALHEIAHSYGFARENEANFLAFLVGRNSKNQDIKYSAILNAFIYLNNALYSADYDLYKAVYASLNEQVKLDLHRRNVYWKQFQGPVKEVSNKANDIYLKSNAQESGVKSYGEVVDLIVAFYADSKNS